MRRALGHLTGRPTTSDPIEVRPFSAQNGSYFHTSRAVLSHFLQSFYGIGDPGSSQSLTCRQIWNLETNCIGMTSRRSRTPRHIIPLSQHLFDRLPTVALDQDTTAAHAAEDETFVWLPPSGVLLRRVQTLGLRDLNVPPEQDKKALVKTKTFTKFRQHPVIRDGTEVYIAWTFCVLRDQTPQASGKVYLRQAGNLQPEMLRPVQLGSFTSNRLATHAAQVRGLHEHAVDELQRLAENLPARGWCLGITEDGENRLVYPMSHERFDQLSTTSPWGTGSPPSKPIWERFILPGGSAEPAMTYRTLNYHVNGYNLTPCVLYNANSPDRHREYRREFDLTSGTYCRGRRRVRVLRSQLAY